MCYRLFSIFFFANFIYSQVSLVDKIERNRILFKTDMDKAVSELSYLEYEAKKTKDTTSLLCLLDRRCQYYYYKNNITELINYSEELKRYSEEIKNYRFLAMSRVYYAEALSMNNMYDKALSQLQKALEYSEKSESDTIIDVIKGNILISLSNL